MPPGARAAGSSASDGGAGGVPGRVRAGVRRAVHRRRQRVHRLQGEGRGRAALRLPLEAAQAVAGPQQARCSKMHFAHLSSVKPYTRPSGPTYIPYTCPLSSLVILYGLTTISRCDPDLHGKRHPEPHCPKPHVRSPKPMKYLFGHYKSL